MISRRSDLSGASESTRWIPQLRRSAAGNSRHWPYHRLTQCGYFDRRSQPSFWKMSDDNAVLIVHRRTFGPLGGCWCMRGCYYSTTGDPAMSFCKQSARQHVLLFSSRELGELDSGLDLSIVRFLATFGIRAFPPLKKRFRNEVRTAVIVRPAVASHESCTLTTIERVDIRTGKSLTTGS